MTTHSVLFRGVTAPLDEIEIGASRIGGPPDLPVGVSWPLGPDHQRCLPMVVQLRLADLPPTRLPRSGTLWFFAAQLAQYTGTEINEIPVAILYAPANATLVRCAIPPEANDEDYWNATEVARCEGWRTHVSETEHDEPRDDDIHVLFPVRKYSSAFGETPPAGFVPVLELRSDYALSMNWGDAAWATWIVSETDLTAGHFARAFGNIWIG
jgi:hypothetical protein